MGPSAELRPAPQRHDEEQESPQHRFARRAALFAGVLAVTTLTLPLSLTEGEQAANSTTPTQPQHAQHHAARRQHHEATVHCTTVRMRAMEIAIGRACTNNAKMVEVGGGHRDKGWGFGAYNIDGIYKCGFGQIGVIPKMKYPRKGAAASCENYYERVTKQPRTVFKRMNCPDILPELQACRDGTHASEPKPECGKVKLYDNYASDHRSALNIYGTGRGGFSQPRGTVQNIHFRGQIRSTSPKDGSAAMIRSKGAGWGYMAFDCIDKKYLTGGPITILSADQKRRINQNPQARHILHSLENQNND